MDKIKKNNIMSHLESTKGKYFAKYHTLVFWFLAINPLYLYFAPKSPTGWDPHLYLPLCLALLFLIVGVSLEIVNGIFRELPFDVKFLWFILIVWAFIITFHNFEFSVEAIRYVFGRAFGAGTWFAPLAMLAGTQIVFWRKIVKHFEIHTFIGIILSIIFGISLLFGYKILKGGEFFFKNLVPKYQIVNLKSLTAFLYASGFLLLCMPTPYGKKRLIAFLGDLFLFFYRGFLLVFRNRMFKYGNYILFYVLHWLFTQKEKFIFQKFLVIYFGIIYICFVGWSFYTGSVPSFLKQHNIYLKQKLFRNSRKNLFKAFWKDMSRSKIDIIIGRGSWGKWGCYKDYYKNIKKGRLHIENGYAYILLKGGLITLIPFLLLSLKAFFLGIKAKNWFIRSCALYIFLRLLDMFPYGLPMFDGNYLIYWLCVGACFKKEFREMSDSDWQEVFYKGG